MLAEDIEDECCTVDDLGRLADDLLKIDLLGWSQLVIEDDDVGIECPDSGDDLVDLTLADEGLGNGRIETLGEGADDFGAVGLRQPAQLCERVLEKPFGPAEVDTDEDGAFGDERGGVMLKARHRVPPI